MFAVPPSCFVIVQKPAYFFGEGERVFDRDECVFIGDQLSCSVGRSGDHGGAGSHSVEYRQAKALGMRWRDKNIGGRKQRRDVVEPVEPQKLFLMAENPHKALQFASEMF